MGSERGESEGRELVTSPFSLTVYLSVSLKYQSFSPSLFFSLSLNDKTKIILFIKIKIIIFDTCFFRKMLKSSSQKLRDTDNKFTLKSD